MNQPAGHGPDRRAPHPAVARALAYVLCAAPLAASDAATPIFEDVARETGLDFVHFNGMSGELYLLETMGSGAALLDYDGDGDLDVYLVQSGRMLGADKSAADATFPPAGPLPLSDRLFRNDLAPGPDGAPVPRFVDVTERSGLRGATGYGMGVATADYDNDGWIDLYLTNWGPNQMWRNRGDGTFGEVIVEAGTDDARWSVPASFLDFDADGWLDLFVGNYVEFNLEVQPRCTSLTGAPDYCGPLAYRPQTDRIFRNRHDGTFEDVTVRSGISGGQGGALGAVAADFDGKGWSDLYVANDMMPNQLWINQGDGTFRDEALLAGAAVSGEGQPQASMGVDAGDFDGDGDEDLFMTHLTGEPNTLYLNDGRGNFSDRSRRSGLGTPSWRLTGFGTSWFDYDNDGWLDLLAVNGAVKLLESLVRAGDPYPLGQPDQLFRNLGETSFEDVTAVAGATFEAARVGRGAAFGDFDNDGDADVVVVNNSGPAYVLRNRVGDRAAWLGARLLAGSGPRDAIGARIRVRTADGRELWRRVRTDGSYASASDTRVLAGLGAGGRATELAVSWPGGGRTLFRDPPAGAYLRILRPDLGGAP